MNRKFKKIFFSTVVGLGAMLYSSNAFALEVTTNTKLDSDVTDGIHVPSGVNVSLDLNGYKVTGSVVTTDTSTSNRATIVNEGTLLISDSSSTKSGLVEGGTDGSYAVLNRNGNLTINGGNYSIVISAYNCKGTNKSGCYTYTGPSLISNGWYNGAENNNGTYSELIINDGVFNGGINNVKNDEYGKLTINGGTFNSLKYTDVVSTNSPILTGYNILTGGKSFKLTGGTFDSDIGVQMAGADVERTFEVIGGSFDEDAPYGSRIDYVSPSNKTNIYTSFIVKNVNIQKMDISNLNIKDLTISNSKFPLSLTLKVSGDAVLTNVTSGKTFTLNGNAEISDSSFETIKIGTSANSNVKLLNVKADLLNANRVNTNVTIEGGEYGKVANSTNSASKTASSGSTITIDKDSSKNIPIIGELIATGAGKINVNNAKINGTVETNYNSNINIKDGKFAGSLVINDVTNTKGELIPGGTIEISGGEFINSITTGTISEGYSKYKLDEDNYIVLKKVNMPENDKIVLKVGETYNIGILDNEYYTSSISGDAVVIKDGVASAKKNGKTIVTLTSKELIENTEISKIELVVYDIIENVTEEAKETNDVTYESISDIIDKIIKSEKVDNVDSETTEKIKTAIENGEIIETELVATEVDETKVDKTSKEKIENEVKKLDDNAVVTKYIDISVIIKANNKEIGKITKLFKPVEITIPLPKDIKEVEKNYERTYFVIRVHDGKATLLKSTYKDGNLIFKTDSFSDYAYGYIDIKKLSDLEDDEKAETKEEVKEEIKQEEKVNTKVKNNPHTGDMLINFIIILFVSIIGVVYFVIYKNKKFAKNN